MRIADDCVRCLARNDGAFGTYCHHVAFAESCPGEGRLIRNYPQTPKWCPGMVRDLSAECRPERRRRDAGRASRLR